MKSKAHIVCDMLLDQGFRIDYPEACNALNKRDDDVRLAIEYIKRNSLPLAMLESQRFPLWTQHLKRKQKQEEEADLDNSIELKSFLIKTQIELGSIRNQMQNFLHRLDESITKIQEKTDATRNT